MFQFMHSEKHFEQIECPPDRDFEVKIVDDKDVGQRTYPS